MTTYTTYVSYGEPWRFMCEHYGITPDQAKEIMATEPGPHGSREARYQAIKRMVAKAKQLRAP